jgi:FkbH-like protein
MVTPTVLPAPIDELTALARGGDLAGRYPTVAPLLAGLDPADLLHAGRLLTRLDPAEVRRAHPATPTVSVAITGHGTLAALPPALTAEAARHGVLVTTLMTDFGGYVTDLGDPASALYAADTDLVLCVVDAVEVFDQLPSAWTVDGLGDALDEVVGRLTALAARFTATARGTLVLNTMPLPGHYPAQLVDHASRARLGVLWRTANSRLLDLAVKSSRIVVLDLDPLVADGAPVTDPRLSMYAKAHLSDALLSAYARQVGHLCRGMAGRTRKCLVLDLDNTLWGGVLGDDGADGIEVADSYRGEAFRAFQRVVRQLGSQGVLLTAVSKNDMEPVRQVLREHPRMTLREDDFVAVVANWRPKHENLRELAATLNIGLDSMVFVDDSPYERGLVRQELPEVTVVAVDDEPAGHVAALLGDGWFDVREVTAEDRSRTVLYRDEANRRSFLHSFDSLDDYLRNLDVTVRLDRVTPDQFARLSQLTLRTNQFNLTTTRLQPDQVRALAEDPAHLVLTIGAGDRFGDNGLVGAVFAHRSGGDLHIDNMLLSCRVFARGIEQTCLAAVLRHAAATGVRAVHGRYVATAKNGGVHNLYQRYGFTVTADDGVTITTCHDLGELPAPADHVRLVTSLEGAHP